MKKTYMLFVMLLSFLSLSLWGQNGISKASQSKILPSGIGQISGDNLYIGSKRYLINRTFMSSLTREKFDTIFLSAMPPESFRSSSGMRFPDALGRYFSDRFQIDWYMSDSTLYVGNIFVQESTTSTREGFYTLEQLSGQKRIWCDTLPNVEGYVENVLPFGTLGLIKATWVNGVFYVKSLDEDCKWINGKGENKMSVSDLRDQWLSLPWTRLTFKNGMLIESEGITSEAYTTRQK